MRFLKGDWLLWHMQSEKCFRGMLRFVLACQLDSSDKGFFIIPALDAYTTDKLRTFVPKLAQVSSSSNPVLETAGGRLSGNSLCLRQEQRW